MRVSKRHAESKILADGMTRRQILASTGAAIPLFGLAGTSWSASPRPASATDAHVHLFNAADLPVKGFAQYVVGREWIGDGPVVAAVIHLIGNFVQAHSVTVEQEARALGTAAADGMDPATFGRAAASYIVQQAEPSTKNRIEFRVQDSYRQLENALLREAGVAPANKSIAARQATIASTLARIAAQSERGNPVALESLARSIAAVCDKDTISVSDGLRLIGWAYLLSKGRDFHLRNYVANFTTAAAAPRTIVNHLVDYDYWLMNEPHSDPIALLQLFEKIGELEQRRGRIDALHSFAGLCPLRLAIERKSSGPALFDRFKDLHKAGVVKGFKLYPPMGFLPDGNRKHTDDWFKVPEGRLQTPLKRWAKVSHGKPLGAALDDALHELYAYCDKHDAPIMAHSRRSNDSAPGFDARAAPEGWLPVVQSYRIKFLIGHLIDGAKCFTSRERNGMSDRSWDLRPSIALLKGRFKGEVFGDLSYMPELANDPALARQFFVMLRDSFGDDGLGRVCFGSDWIMLAQEPNNGRYLRALIEGMEGAKYLPAQVDGIVRGNAARYLA